MKMKTKEVKLPVSAADISISEAFDLLIEAERIDDTIQEYQAKGLELPIGKMIAANMLISLAVELYLKSFMILGRKDGMRTGHKLDELYDLLPPFLKKAIEERYAKTVRRPNRACVEFAFIQASETSPPGKPTFDSFADVDFDNFNSSLAAIANLFVDSRYFFEQVAASKWVVFKYYFEPALVIAKTLQRVLADFKHGAFKGALGKA